jgi:hypothetical protein
LTDEEKIELTKAITKSSCLSDALKWLSKITDAKLSRCGLSLIGEISTPL